MEMTAQTIAFWGFLIISIIILLFAFLVLWKIFTNEINLHDLLAEPPPPGQTTGESKASLSRFQFLIFTFVIAGMFLMLSIEAGTFVEIPTNVLALLGISGGSYVVSKAIGKTNGNGGSSSKSPVKQTHRQA
jgi:hypothetical protein